MENPAFHAEYSKSIWNKSEWFLADTYQRMSNNVIWCTMECIKFTHFSGKSTSLTDCSVPIVCLLPFYGIPNICTVSFRRTDAIQQQEVACNILMYILFTVLTSESIKIAHFTFYKLDVPFRGNGIVSSTCCFKIKWIKFTESIIFAHLTTSCMPFIKFLWA